LASSRIYISPPSVHDFLESRNLLATSNVRRGTDLGIDELPISRASYEEYLESSVINTGGGGGGGCGCTVGSTME